MSNNIDHPSHYNAGKIEAIDVIKVLAGYNLDNVEDYKQKIREIDIEIDQLNNQWSLDLDVQSMALKKNLLPYVSQLRNTILETYRGVIFVNSKLIEDPEAPDYERISFEIHLTGEPTQILEDEKAFHTIFFQKVPDEKQKFFTFTYMVKKPSDLIVLCKDCHAKFHEDCCKAVQ